ncbi:VOC family protein [Bacillaceae bacterium CLA-AA-H227]|uniref:VOC family protein n=1 Tax=Robertmurraya yapensis (ex Hitch et al 2024) TaxID=3133160 RepID=A0ACC6S5F6_9BACI
MLNQVCVLTIKVTNMEEAVDFYTNVLDFSVAKKYGENIISLDHNGLPLILEKAEKVNVPSSSSVLLAINSSNIQEDFKKLQDKGVKILFDEPKPCPPGYFFVIEDNSGNHLEIVEFVD